MPQPRSLRQTVRARQPAEIAVPPSREGAPSAADELAAILAQYTTYGHAFREMAIGPEMAAVMLTRNFDNRPIRARKYKSMGLAMAEGRWGYDGKPTAECVKFDLNGVLRDGQHRLLGIIDSGATIMFTVCFGCHPKETKFYDQGTPRSVSDIAREHGHENTVLASALVALVLRIELETTDTLDRILLTERLDELFADDPKFDIAIKAAGRVRSITPISAGGFAYWWIATHTTKPNALDGFWDRLATGADLPLVSPVLGVRKYMHDYAERRSSRDGVVKLAAAIVHAWNGYATRKRVRSFKWEHTTRMPEVV